MGNHADWGGGILAGKQRVDPPYPSPLVEGNLIQGNISEYGGGGILLFRSHAVITGNVFRGNEGKLGDGGGIDAILHAGSCEICGNEFWENTAGDQGGAILAATAPGAGPVLIEGNLIAENTARGIGPDVAQVGAGGGIATWTLNGVIRNNTIADNTALPDNMCTGGGLRIWGASTSLLIELNIIANNMNCGVICRQDTNAIPSSNLLWENLGGNFESCSTSWNATTLSVDPDFCGRQTGDYRVAEGSPALAGPLVIGAFSEAGCPPVATIAITWGRLKALYGQGKEE